MKLPEGAIVRREHALTEQEVKQIEDWLEVKQLAQKRMRDSHRRYTEADTIFTGKLAEKKWELGWQDADNVVYDSEAGKLLDVIPGVDENGRCLSCGEVHDPEDHS